MASDPKTPPESAPKDANTKESFIHIEEKWKEWQAYKDLFQQDGGGTIRIGPKAKKPILEIITMWLGYVLIIGIIVTLGFSVDVFLRSQKQNAIAEKYRFLCPYISLGIVDKDPDECRTLTMIRDYYTAEKDKIEEETLKNLAQYIPIKVSKNLIEASPEKAFIVKKYESKVRFDAIIDKFEKVRSAQQYVKQSNIICTGISMNESGNMSTQCIIYGGDIGSDGSNGKLWSSRIEALKFIDALGETDKSEFIVMDPPLALSTEELTPGSNGDYFTTRTIVPLQLQYVPINSNGL